MNYGFVRLASASPKMRVADCKYNCENIKEDINFAAKKMAAAIVFPELCVTGYTCGDLFNQPLLIDSAQKYLKKLIEDTKHLDILCAVGVPVSHKSALYNCIAVFKSGTLLGLVPKVNIPNYSEFYEMRHFTAYEKNETVNYCGFTVPFGKLIFNCENEKNLKIGFEVCEDMWVAHTPSTTLCQNGASVIMNASCSNETVGKAQYRRDLVSINSGKMMCAYVYSDSAMDESSTDLVFSGHRIISENASVLSESELFTHGITYADVDVQKLENERQRMNTWTQKYDEDVINIFYKYSETTFENFEIDRKFEKNPFVPMGDKLKTRCKNILDMQCAGLMKRISHIGIKNVVLGLSGGLDSTLALLVTVRAFDKLNIDRKGIQAVSMPGFGTTSRTKNNSEALAVALGVSFKEIPIKDAVLLHFSDIGQNPDTHDITYENSQARERTQLIMDIANMQNGIVIGTGDLSELALGFATYNGDHMSMYGVNASVPKTLVRHLVGYMADVFDKDTGDILRDVLNTPVSPELLPPKGDEIAQVTENIVGPYELHDFFMYYMLRFGFEPKKIFKLCSIAYGKDYSSEEIKKWLRMFYSRFFSQQFKRSCLPDGPKVGSVGLSPRGDFRMPSDACSTLWLLQIDSL